MLELMRAPEIERCRRCKQWFLHRRGFGDGQRWCSRTCWRVSRERRAIRRQRGPRILFVSGPCAICGKEFTAGIGIGTDPCEHGGKFCSLACDRSNKKRVNRVNRLAAASLPCTAHKCPRLRGPDDALCCVCFDMVKRSCVGKQRLRTSDEARRRLWLHRSRVCNRGPVCPGVSAYWCFICGTRHMGHTTAEMRQTVNRAARALADSMTTEQRLELSTLWRNRRRVLVG